MSLLRKSQKKSGGFTLPEVIVTITLIAALAAVVVPSIASQLKKADPNRVASDAEAIKGAVEQFLTDVRRYPNSIGQLTNTIVASSSAQPPLAGSVPSTLLYVSGDVTRWKGPYLSKDSIGALPTGYNWSFISKFFVDTLPSSGVTGSSTGTKWMVLKAPSSSFDNGANALLLDQLYDDGDLNSGSIRYRICASSSCSPTTAADTIKFLLLPIS